MKRKEFCICLVQIFFWIFLICGWLSSQVWNPWMTTFGYGGLTITYILWTKIWPFFPYFCLWISQWRAAVLAKAFQSFLGINRGFHMHELTDEFSQQPLWLFLPSTYSGPISLWPCCCFTGLNSVPTFSITLRLCLGVLLPGRANTFGMSPYYSPNR